MGHSQWIFIVNIQKMLSVCLVFKKGGHKGRPYGPVYFVTILIYSKH
jgi:hypothetical protein